jgi:hypothetical protein
VPRGSGGSHTGHRAQAHNRGTSPAGHHGSRAAPVVTVRHRDETPDAADQQVWPGPGASRARRPGCSRQPHSLLGRAGLLSVPVTQFGAHRPAPPESVTNGQNQCAVVVHMIEQRPCIAEICADHVPGSARPATGVAAERVGRCLQRLRQRLRVRLRVRYWLRLRLRFRLRQRPRLRPGFPWRRHRRRHRRGHRRRLHRFGPRRLWPRGFRLRCSTSIGSGLWRHLAGPLADRHRGLTGTICGHPEMIPSRAPAHHAAADQYRRPARLPAHALTSRA